MKDKYKKLIMNDKYKKIGSIGIAAIIVMVPILIVILLGNNKINKKVSITAMKSLNQHTELMMVYLFHIMKQMILQRTTACHIMYTGL